MLPYGSDLLCPADDVSAVRLMFVLVDDIGTENKK